MLPKKKNKSKIVLNLVLFIVLLAASAFIIFFRQRIVDQISFWQFEPTSEVSALTNRLALTSEGTFYLYASHPDIESAADFNSSCSRIENTTSILGCFSNNQIYIYDVTDKRLDGIREVTAAHEMLHAVYQRLSDAEKDQLSILLEAEYKKLSSDANFVDLMAFYAKTEPGERFNELHSVIGTSVANLDPQLEAHYQKYFFNRQTIVAYNDAYNSVFNDLSNQAAALSEQLNILNASIPTASDQYNISARVLNADVDSFNIRANNGDFDSWNQFYSERAELVSRSATINATRVSINADIENFNTLLNKYNSIALESQQLYNSIDSTLVDAESL